MGKYIVIHDGKTVKHIERIGHDFTAEDVVVVDEMPQYTEQEGKFGELVYTEEDGLHYEYKDMPEQTDQPTYEELLEMFSAINDLEVDV